MTKARDTANLLADGSISADELSSTLDLSGKTVTLADGVGGHASGTQANRPSTPSVGTTYFNTDADTLQQYTSSGWADIGTTPTATAVSGQNNSATDYFDLPSGTSAQRPGSPAAGMFRFNSTNTQFEGYTGNAWVGMATDAVGIYSVDALIVAGGGSGGAGAGSGDGGGGAGGYLAYTGIELTSGNSYSIVVGAGGNVRANGDDSSALGYTAIGGGAGARYNVANANSGGSGGGGRGGGPNDGGGGANVGTTGQGKNGGNGYHVNGDDTQGGGGGGASANGGNAGGGGGGSGGAGLTWSNGTTYAGGGGGGSRARSQGGGGAGGGGAATGSGSANTGGGGGASGSGGSGIVIIRYSGAQRGSGGSVSTAGGYTYHTFTSSSSYTA